MKRRRLAVSPSKYYDRCSCVSELQIAFSSHPPTVRIKERMTVRQGDLFQRNTAFHRTTPVQTCVSDMHFPSRLRLRRPEDFSSGQSHERWTEDLNVCPSIQRLAVPDGACPDLFNVDNTVTS